MKIIELLRCETGWIVKLKDFHQNPSYVSEAKRWAFSTLEEAANFIGQNARQLTEPDKKGS